MEWKKTWLGEKDLIENKKMCCDGMTVMDRERVPVGILCLSLEVSSYG